jgi:oligoribonuclease
MPEVVEHLHYRVIDVSTIKELSRRWFARAYFQSPAKMGGHRALGDIKDSIDELRYYREAVFVPAPGPDSATAQRIAKKVMGTAEEAAAAPAPVQAPAE